ncbi:MAG: nuclear transport factor 2 family protein [Bacteroidota bacterium]
MKSLTVLCMIALFVTGACNASEKGDQDTTQLTASQDNEPGDQESKKTMEIAMAFMDAMGKGDMDKMVSLMHDDMVWQNAGDSDLPWIGPWKGKKAILEEFMPAFGANFQTIKWEPNDAFASGNTAAFFGQMVGLLTKSNKKTKEFTYALRVKVKDGKVILWNWFEDSYEVSKAYKDN